MVRNKKEKVFLFLVSASKSDFFVVVSQLHEDAPTEEHPANLTILLS